MLLFSTDKKRLHAHFQKDPVLFAYHLGDLDDFYFNDCQWMVDYAERARIEEAILVYSGLETPSVLAFGLGERFVPLLKDALNLFPSKFYCHFLSDYRDIISSVYIEKPLGTHLKMKLTGDTGFFKKAISYEIVSLNQSHADKLKELYRIAYPANYFNKRMLESGKYLGCFDDGKLIGVAGVHVDSDEYKIAVLGNITTHPNYLNQSIASVLTSHLTSSLVNRKKEVSLNVKADNKAAIAVYEKLGFEKYCEYEEALFVIK